VPWAPGAARGPSVNREMYRGLTERKPHLSATLRTNAFGRHHYTAMSYHHRKATDREVNETDGQRRIYRCILT